MQNNDAKQSTDANQALTAAQVADRMGLTTRQLQDLRLRGIGPQIVQRGLSIHYEVADVRQIERHEAMAIIEQVLASDRPLALLRAMVEPVGIKLSPTLQQVNLPALSPTIEPIQVQTSATPAKKARPEMGLAVQATAPEPLPATPPTLTIITSTTTAWYLVHTKPRQEDVALTNLERQGYECYLPQMRIERVRRRKAEIATEPMFPRYLFVRLGACRA